MPRAEALREREKRRARAQLAGRLQMVRQFLARRHRVKSVPTFGLWLEQSFSSFVVTLLHYYFDLSYESKQLDRRSTFWVI